MLQHTMSDHWNSKINLWDLIKRVHFLRRSALLPPSVQSQALHKHQTFNTLLTHATLWFLHSLHDYLNKDDNVEEQPPSETREDTKLHE